MLFSCVYVWQELLIYFISFQKNSGINWKTEKIYLLLYNVLSSESYTASAQGRI